ncbi:MAG TPA: toll/interleukin-1 receptor domain-containing protein [Acidobacteriaceae bacterium]|jgi:hypothetical protein|nr:toll/interleukin-1 receptor domain-containing protein [Acidobacteriaceae bacterium]
MAANYPVHLFISYATEDSALAAWLARQLAVVGYAVWIDQLKMLGGEPWPQTIDDAIKNKTFRMVALISRYSIGKPKPTKERTLAQRISEQRSIKDFLIPLKLDETELDWMTGDISYISFREGWAEGLRRLLEKLESISAPIALKDGSHLAKASLDQGRDLIRESTEQVLANIMRVKNVPQALLGYKWNQHANQEVKERVLGEWDCCPVGNDAVLAFDEPPLGAREFVGELEGKYEWFDNEVVFEVNPRGVVGQIVLRIVRKQITDLGFLPHPKRDDVFYLPESYSTDGKLHFEGISRKQTWLKIKGKASFITPGKPREINFHHFAISVRVARGIDREIWLKVSPNVFFVDASGQPIVDDRVGPRRRRLTSNWWNNKWANRLLAIESLFSRTQSNSSGKIALDSFLRLDAPFGIDEGRLLSLGNDENEELDDLTFIIEPDAASEKDEIAGDEIGPEPKLGEQ